MTSQKIISWVEIPATDFNRAVKFYSTILNVKFSVVEGGKEKMACFPSGEGAISHAPGFKPSKDGALVSFNIEKDMDSTLVEIEKLGGKIVQPKTKIDAEGRGYFSIFVDCEGNKAGLYGDA